MADKDEMFRETRELGLKYAFSFGVDEGDDAVATWNVMAARVRWKQGGFDNALLRIADERAAPTLWISAESGAVFAPYDGGVDMFLPSEAEAKDLRSKYADWLSSHPDGM